LAELIREEFGVRWTVFAMLVLLVANGTVTIAEFAGIAAAGELFGIPRYVAVPIAAALAWSRAPSRTTFSAWRRLPTWSNCSSTPGTT
jgi:hypothetical protein